MTGNLPPVYDWFNCAVSFSCKIVLLYQKIKPRLVIAQKGVPMIKGGGSGLLFWKSRFWDMSWRGRPGHIPTFWGWFWVHARNVAHVRPRSKNEAKNLKQRRYSFDFVTIRFINHFQKRMSKSKVFDQKIAKRWLKIFGGLNEKSGFICKQDI